MSRSLTSMLERLADGAKQGVGLDGPFRELARTAGSSAWRTMMDDIAASLSAGSTLAVALERHGALLPSRVRHVLSLAEAEGNLPRALDALLIETDARSEVRRLLRGALLGPAVSLSLVGVALGVGAAFAIPEAASWFALWGGGPTGLTGSLLGSAGALPRGIWLALGALPAILLALMAVRRRDAGVILTGPLAPIALGQRAIVALLDARVTVASGGSFIREDLLAALTPLARCVFESALPSRGAELALDDALHTARDELDATTRRLSRQAAITLTVITGLLVLCAGVALLWFQLSVLDAPHVGVIP